MKYTQLKKIFVLLLFMMNTLLFAQIPDGGILLNDTIGVKVGTGTLTVVDVEGQDFSEAYEFATSTNVNDWWDTKLKFPAVYGITENDVILITFMARTTDSGEESGEGYLTVVIESLISYDKQISQQLAIGSEWKRCYASLKCTESLSVNIAHYALFLGYPSQTLEIADVQFLNYENTIALEDLPVTEITYEGQDEDAAWREPAQQRIETIRKGIVDIVVYDEQGELLPDAEVTIEMQKHKFGFGTAVKAVDVESTAIREKMLEYFNEVVFENDLKWVRFDSEDTYDIGRAFQTLKNYEIPVRGHVVMWGSWEQTPEWLKDLKSDPVALRAAIDQHIDDVTQFTSGKVVDWDVINEAFKENDIMKILGNEIMADWFKRVRNNDPQANLYLNEYSILSGGGNNTEKQDFYYNLIQFIEENGGQVDGIGMQGHFGSQLTSIDKVNTILDRYAELGKEIKITEHDIDIDQRLVQADYTRDFLTICFSHESVKSFVFWGWWVYRHWKPDAALIGPNWEPRPHGEEYIDLVFNHWWTKDTTNITDTLGAVSFNGFLGDYTYIVKSGGIARNGTFIIDNSIKSGKSNSLVLSMNTAVPDQIKITANKSEYLCEGENITLTTVNVDGAEYAWYRNGTLLSEQTYSLLTNEAGIYTVNVTVNNIELVSSPFEVFENPFPTVEIQAVGDLNLVTQEQIELKANVSSNAAYNWYRNDTIILGSVPSIIVNSVGTYHVSASSNGCSKNSSTLEVHSSTGINDILHKFRVFPNPAKESFQIQYQLLDSEAVTATLYNALGQVVISVQLMQVSGNARMDLPNPGWYVLRISSSKGLASYKLVGS
jgi:GH35 family endo-1,4-beta-xylanase